MLLPLALLGVVATLHPPLLLKAVDLTRSIVGPAPVAYVETAVFNVGTLIRRARVQLGDTAPRWTLQLSPTPTGSSRATAGVQPAVAPAPTAATQPTARPAPTGTPVAVSAATIRPSLTPLPPSPAARPTAPATPTAAATPAPITLTPLPTVAPLRLPTLAPRQEAIAPRDDWPPPPLPALINDGQLPGEGQWQLLSASGDGGSPAMAVTVLRPDPTRPDIQVAVVAIDMTRAQLHMVAGLEEPPIITGTTSFRYGVVPPDMQQSGRLLAAFNGGFKAIHGNDGMAADGEVYLPPMRNRATLAIAADGSLRMGLWGRDVGPDASLVAYRQNGKLLVDGGTVTEQARQGGLGWGTTVDLQAETWRSGVGLSADGRTLLYAVGDALTAARLAEVLRAAGSWMALQLDINNYYVRFVTFQQHTESGRPVALPLISAMANEPRKYLVPEARDFFYLTAR